jgi:sulfur-oxidizing protein SoxZ
MARTLINLPKTVRRGAAFDIRILIAHPMESGYRRNEMGQAVPRDIIHSFTCTYNGETVLEADLHPAIAANPFLSFSAIARESGEIVMTWTDDAGHTESERVAILVEG